MNKKVEELVERVRLMSEEQNEILTGNVGRNLDQPAWLITRLGAAALCQAQLNKVLNDPDLALIDRERELPTMTDGEIAIALLSNSNKIKAVRTLLNKLEEKTINVGFTHSVIPLAEALKEFSDLDENEPEDHTAKDAEYEWKRDQEESGK